MSKLTATARLLLIAALASTVTAPRAQVTVGSTKLDFRPVAQNVPWDGGRVDRRISMHIEGPWEYCRHSVTEHSRNPRERAPADDYSGYRLISISKNSISWQWWVMPWGRFFDRRNHWLAADFNVVWISTSASISDRDQHKCVPQPNPEPVRTWPDPDSPTGVIVQPTPPSEFMAVLRLYCEAKPGSIATTGYVDSSSASNKSCADAKATIEAHANSIDLCESFDSTHRYNGKREWIKTVRCR